MASIHGINESKQNKLTHIHHQQQTSTNVNMNCKEHYLPELELATGQVREALQCLLHTILFIRAPAQVTPRDMHCEGFKLTYTRIAASTNTNTNSSNNNNINLSCSLPNNNNMPGNRGNNNNDHNSNTIENDVDKKVNDAIENFLLSLTPIGPELLQGGITISFFERISRRQLFGFIPNHEERIIFEQWIIKVIVNNTPRPVMDDTASVIERQRIQEMAEGMLRSALLKVFEITGIDIDHIPPVMYEFEILSSVKRVDDRENVYSRVANMPSLISLGS